MSRPHKSAGPFRYFNLSPDVIRLVLLLYVYLAITSDVEDLLFEREFNIRHLTDRI
uniref:hypothetical protein n=1 Tax=uncultured Sphingomonas sp. TaxID=158754 RepID=UPI0035CC8286